MLKVPATLALVPRFGHVGMAAVTATLFVLGTTLSAAKVRSAISSLLGAARLEEPPPGRGDDK
jgi:hypothetical protein